MDEKKEHNIDTTQFVTSTKNGKNQIRNTLGKYVRTKAIKPAK